MPSPTLTLYMQTQRARYAAELPDRIAALEAALRQLGSGKEAALSALVQAHRLAGSGGTFGFPEVSHTAARIERILADKADTPGFPDDAAVAALEAGLKALKAAPAAGMAAADEFDRVTTGVEGPMSKPALPARLLYIIEPDLQVAGQLADAFSRSGYQSRVFSQPVEAGLAAAQELPVAMIATIAFPEEALQALHAAAAPGEVNEIPLVFMNGDTGFQTRLKAVRAGAVGYFPQPVDAQAMVALLDRVASSEPTRPYRVLLVEDDGSLASFYAGLLAAAGMETRIVTEPGQIMAPLLEFQPDLITCDINMPQCNGIELATLIRQQPEFLRIPIVFLSGETNLDKQAQALKQGGDDFITKPVTPAALVSAAQSRARRYRSLLAGWSSKAAWTVSSRASPMARSSRRTRRHATCFA